MNNNIISIFDIKSNFIHLEISKYIPKLKLLKIIKYSKKLQKILNITIENYELFNIIINNKYKNLNLTSKSQSNSLLFLKSIYEITNTNILNNIQTEKICPYVIYNMFSIKKDTIIATTENSILKITYNSKKNTFNFIDEIKIDINGALINCFSINENLIILSNFEKQILLFDLSTNKIIYEITGTVPIYLNNNKIAYIWENKTIRKICVNNLNDDIKNEIDEINIYTNSDKNIDKELNIVSYGILLKNNNILLGLWDKTISEYDFNTKACVNFIRIENEFLNFLLELENEKIIFTCEDNYYIYILEKNNKNDNNNNNKNINYIKAHTDTIIKVIEIENRLISASFDGSLKFWKEENNNYLCIMILLLCDDNIRNIIIFNNRLLLSCDDKTLRAIGLNNKINDYNFEFLEEDKNKNKNKCFQITDKRINNN